MTGVQTCALPISDEAGRAVSRPFAIWKHPERLADELASILREFPQTERVAVTMTAELADCFATKSEGVRFILNAVELSVARSVRVRSQDRAEAPHSESAGYDSSVGGREPIAVWTTDGRFMTANEAATQPMLVAAANWHAQATFLAQWGAHSVVLLIDIGTTTTDIIPLAKGVSVATGLTDLQRLQSGELSYSGVKRTPLCAIAHAVPFREGYCPLAAELFATTLDVYLLLGDIAEDAEDLETANGKPATKAAAHDRLARMLCCDRNEVSFDEVVEIARFLADVQRQRLVGSLERVVSQLSEPLKGVAVSGSGAFLARRLVATNRRTANAWIFSLEEHCSPMIAEAGCAYAVAQLLASREIWSGE